MKTCQVSRHRVNPHLCVRHAVDLSRVDSRVVARCPLALRDARDLTRAPGGAYLGERTGVQRGAGAKWKKIPCM